MDVVVLLEAFPDDVAAKDLNGDSSVHVAASAVDYELVKVRCHLCRGQAQRNHHQKSRPSPRPVYNFDRFRCPFCPSTVGFARRGKQIRARGAPGVGTRLFFFFDEREHMRHGQCFTGTSSPTLRAQRRNHSNNG